MGLKSVFLFGAKNLLIGFLQKRDCFSDKKSSFSEQTKRKSGVYNEKR